MANCDMCGKELEKEKLVLALVEGVEMDVCPGCAKFGKIIRRVQKIIEKPKQLQKPKLSKPRQETIQVIVNNYGKLVRERRQRMGLKQEELAKKISEKASIVQKIETEQFRLSIALARRLESFLGLKLVEQHVEKSQNISLPQTKRDRFTMADFIKVRKKK